MTTINRYRGDTSPDRFIVKDDNGVVDISTGYSFVLTVNSESNPSDTSNQMFALVGVVTDGPNGVVDFTPTSLQADQTPGSYYYDVQVTYPSGAKKTCAKDKYVFKQDISKG